MRAYVEFAVKKFRNKATYRMDCFMGIAATVFSYIVYICIYQALYGTNTEIDGVTFTMVSTGFIFSLGLSNAFSYNEMFMPDKINNGTITNEFLKPVNFRLRLLAENIGESVFKLIFNFIPALIFAVFYTGIALPKDALSVVLMFISVILGYLILWEIGFIVQSLCFWFVFVWGMIVIKNVIVNIFSGIMIPLWFMPEPLMKVIEFTPFESIYFAPLKLYLGQMTAEQILICFLKQIVWVLILWLVGEIIWRKGNRKLVVQGG